MKKFALAWCATLCLAAAGLAQPANLVKNPGFEEAGRDGFASGWTGGEFGKPGDTLVLDSTVAHAGRCSMRIGTRANSFVTCSAEPIPVKPNTRYYLTWWCKTQGFSRARAYLFLQTNKAQRVLSDANQFSSQDWTRHLAEYTTTAAETSLHPVLTTQGAEGASGWCWFDDVEIYEGSFPEPLAGQWQALRREAAGLPEAAVILAKNDAGAVWLDNLAARIYREDGLPACAKPAATYEISAARNEEALFQLSLVPTQDQAEVSLAAQEFTGPGRLASENVRWWRVGYVPIKTANNPETRLGLTPDPLLDPAPATAPKGINTTFCIGVRVPAGAAPGTYQGKLLVKAGAAVLAEVPLSLRVYNFTLPADPAFRTLITYSVSSLARWDKRPYSEIERDVCRVLYAHGIRGCGAVTAAAAKIVDGKVVCDFGPFDARMKRLAADLHFNAFFLGPLFGGGTAAGWAHHEKWLDMEPLSPEFNRYFPDYMRQVAEHLKAKGWFEKAYLYLWDEPEADYFANVVALQKLALQGDPDFKIWETTSTNNSAFYGVVKAWSVPFSWPSFNEETVEAQRRAGDEIWVYNIPASLEIPPQDHRLWFWQAARYGAIGAQLWEVTWYNGINPWEDITPKPCVTGRQGESLYHYAAGEALLLYPNPVAGGPPLSSLRLKLIQKGLDDVGYLTLLQAHIEKAEARHGAADAKAAARERMQALAGRMVGKDLGCYVFDSARLENTRAEIARQIETASAEPLK